jgi:hypothetical protein
VGYEEVEEPYGHDEKREDHKEDYRVYQLFNSGSCVVNFFTRSPFGLLPGLLDIR